MRILRPTVTLLALVLSLAACAAQPDCVAPASRATQVDLYFGRDIAGSGEVSDAQWAQFLDQEVTPRFPAGLTVSDARGQYRDTSTGRIDRERSKRLTIVVADVISARPALDAVAEAYKKRFQQQSVLRIESPVCAAF
jgi:hypothetical protein